MKFLLSFLLCFILVEAQTIAQDTSHIAPNGGPNYGTQGTLVGTYAGVLVPTGSTPSDSLGLFSLGINSTGIGTGVFLLFSGQNSASNVTGGLSFTGNLAAVGDATSGTVQAILSAVAIVSVTVSVLSASNGTTFTNTTYNQTAEGSMTATVANSGIATGTAEELSGTAFLEVVAPPNPGQLNGAFVNMTFSVDGFQQSTSVSVGAAPTLLSSALL